MSGALNSVFGGGGLGALAGIASMVFPPAGLVLSAANLVNQVIGQGVNQAVQQLTQQCGMPKFIGQEIQQVVKQVIDQLTQHSDPHCDGAVKEQAGGILDDFLKSFTKNVCESALEHMTECKGKGKGSSAGGSWFEALAKALGSALDKQEDKIKALSDKIGAIDEAGKGIDQNDKQAVKQNDSDRASTMTDLQAASQKMSFLMSSASDTIKTLGGALKEMAAKG